MPAATHPIQAFRRGLRPRCGCNPPRSQRWVLRAIAGVMVALAGLWVAVHRIPGVAGTVTDALRSVAGVRFVARLEDAVYGLEDALRRRWQRDEAPAQLWQPSTAAAPPAPRGTRHFPPPPARPPIARVALADDGQWQTVPGAREAASGPVLARTSIHPDAERPYSVVAVVAIDARAVRLHAVPGTVEPVNPKIGAAARGGLIPRPEWASLIAAFDGGFKTVHGHFGAMFDRQIFLPPVERSCTLALYRDGSLRIGPWSTLEASLPSMQSFRQTPPCLADDGALNPLLEHARPILWGGTVDGDTVIRRSAIGWGERGGVLYYGLGEFVSATTLAVALLAAGARDVAELDVNYSFVRFLIYPPDWTDRPHPVPLLPRLLFTEGEYVEQPADRDFFYIALGSE